MRTAAFINGVRTDPDDVRLKCLDPYRSDTHGVFETMVFSKGRIADIDAHLRRLRSSARIKRQRLSHSTSRIATFLREAARSLNASIVRLKIVDTGTECVVHAERYVKSRLRLPAGSATFLSMERTAPAAKALPYHREARAWEKAAKKGHTDAFIVDRNGNVPEGACSNVFWVKDGVLLTPGKKILPGITRSNVLRLAKTLSIKTVIHDAKRGDLLGADEVFITKTTTGITPITKINKTLIGSGKTGALTKKLMRNF